MGELKQIDTRALKRLKAARLKLSPQQYRVLKGQVLAGEPEAALRGLDKILGRCADDVEENRADRCR